MPVYLDCASTTPVDPRVRDAVLRHLDEDFGNAHSRTHDFGAVARRAVERARDRVAAVVGCGRGEVVFTSGATESNNLALLGLADHGTRVGKRHVVSTAIEHASVLEPLAHLATRGFEVTLVPPAPGGFVEAASVAAALRPDTLLVSVMHANNETGVVQPVSEIDESLRGHDAFLHVDAAQGFGKDLSPLRNSRVDLVSISGHKIYAPKGVGALVTRRRDGKRPPRSPLLFGGGQELGLRPGTLPVPLVAGLGVAAELALHEHSARNERCLAFRSRLLDALAPLAPVVHGELARALPQIVNLSFPGVTAEDAMEALRDLVAISNGSACTSQSEHCSHVLGAMRLPPDRAEGALRFSWCHATSEPDWKEVVGILASLGRSQTVSR